MERTLESTVLHIATLRLVTDYPRQVEACLEALTDDELWWRPNEGSNAPGNIVVHLAWSNRYYLEEVIGGRSIGRDREAEFSRRGGLSRDDVQSIWTEAVQAVEGVLQGIAPSQLMDTTDRTGKTTTYAQVLMHVVHHNAGHVGQLVWITKMLRPGAVDGIWMRARAT